MVIHVTDATFETDVLERSRTTPVVVDFWAEWCGPCKQLAPTLESAARAREGKVVLAKLDTDSNQQLASAFRIQGIPAVKAFKDGRVVDEFTGVQPPAVVDRFFDRLIPSEAEMLASSDDEASLLRALELEPGRADAAVALARIALGRDERDEAIRLLEDVRDSYQADAILARLALEPEVPELAPAFADLDGGRIEPALEALISAIPHHADRKDDLRKVIVGVLDELGVDSEAAREYRRRLATALY